jgi:hypothetical protein
MVMGRVGQACAHAGIGQACAHAGIADASMAKRQNAKQRR